MNTFLLFIKSGETKVSSIQENDSNENNFTVSQKLSKFGVRKL